MSVSWEVLLPLTLCLVSAEPYGYGQSSHGGAGGPGVPQGGGDVLADPGYFSRGGYDSPYGVKKGGYHTKTGSSYHRPQMSCGKLAPPMNSAMKCANGVCIATCLSHYTFPGGQTSLTFYCTEGRWTGEGMIHDKIQECSPSCVPQCQNGGQCVSPNVCHCPDLFFGPYCQYERKPCYDLPPTPMNSHKVCTADTCTIACSDGHAFHDGSSVATIMCKDGEWRPARSDWVSVPDCLGVCSPPCQHGGICYGFNVCQCPQEFRGKQCQYSKEVCDVRNLGFNGNYNCSGDDETWSCRLDCPTGMRFISPPAASYTCRYETAAFEPHVVPTCVFENGFENDEFVFEYSGATSAPETSHEFIIHESNKTSKYITKTSGGSQSKKGVLKQKRKPTGGTCVTWRREHFKTFDGKILSFKSDCIYNLLSNDDNTFHIQSPVLRGEGCQPSTDICSSITVFIDDKEYQIFVNGQGKPSIKGSSGVISVPSQVPGMKVDLGSKSIKANIQTSGVIIVWNMKDVVEIQVSESSWNKTSGLCGRMDGLSDNELTLSHGSVEEYASEARVLTTGEICQEKVQDNPPCSDTALQQKAQEFCSVLLHSSKFRSCHETVSVRQYYEACMWDFCSCETSGNLDCGCEAISMYVKECRRAEIELPSWRDEDLCGVKCTGGRVYRECGRDTPCGGDEEVESEGGGLSGGGCEEGCFCPRGLRSHQNGSCLPPEACPCPLRGKEFQSGASVPSDCNTCTCSSGKWVCTELECGAECEAVGDPHYKTFDKRKFDFMGKCSYYLLKMDNYSIEAENVPCDGAISENMGFVGSSLPGLPSCTKTVTVRLGEKTVVKLRQRKEVTVNGEELRLPVSLKEAYLSQPSSLFILVELSDGVEVWWDGATSVYIHAPPSLKGKTKGLCGTFNGNQKDDFLTPEGDIEQDAVSFANKWRIKESCDSDIVEEKDPCQVNVQNKALAEKYCSQITSNLFLDCHFHVDPVSYHQSCMYDMCSCSKKKSDCFCPIISAYAKECAAQGIPIDWRSNVRECGLQCPRGQIYETCARGCSRSCEDISRGKKCRKLCLEGCFCPPGFALDSRAVCVPLSSCPCQLNGLQYPPGHAEIRPASKGLQLCTCTNALWECHLASTEELKNYPNNSLEDVTCSATKNKIYSHCEPPEPLTCQNMHSIREGSSPSICHGGCVCKKGWVLDSLTRDCVRPEECPCHHGGRSYSDGSLIQEDCNTCSCKQGKWECSEHDCPGVCSAWGDSHFRTFDERLFDFQGTCDYVLAKGSLTKHDCFTVSLEMASCGSSGISCPKSLKVSVGSSDSKETVVFADKAAHPANGTKRITVRAFGLNIFADVPELGLVVQWDRGSRVSVRVDPRWKGKVHGLCGNYNGDSSDDFMTPSGGISEVSPQIFGDSWKLFDYCPIAQPIKDACELHPNRKAWSLEKCSVLKSDLFKPCHSEVPLDFYLEKCIFDSCACDEGGDCDCLCSAIAAYAQECNAHGVHVSWRKQDFCPIQCDETCASYQPCVSTCPPETCENYLNHRALTKMCKQDICVEGCKLKPCPPGEIYKNSSYSECVPAALCKSVCLTINGVDYYEGDFIEGDECHSCYCSRKAKSCSGVPCTPPPASTSTPTQPPSSSAPSTTTIAPPPVVGDKDVCVTGWTDWTNQTPLPSGKYNLQDIEPLPDFKLNKGLGIKGAHCPVSAMTEIRCRTLGSHLKPKETGEDVECSLERGLVCNGGCSDYEIQVYCQCEPRKEEIIEFTVGTSEADTTVLLTTQPSTSTTVTQPTSTVSSTTQRKITEATVGATLPPVTTESVCKAGEVWDDCAFQCDNLCLYYEYTLYQSGTCLFGLMCRPGCRPANREDCGDGFRWRDEGTCVKEEDCTCKSHSGEIVKPGQVVKESECKVCQCLNNRYTCDDSACFTTELPPSSSSTTLAPTPLETLVISSTVTPPADTCPQNKFIPMLNDLPETAFSSSSLNPNFIYAPKHARLNSLEGSWRPGTNDEKQYIQIDLGRVDVIYGITLKGDLIINSYVTRYYVLYSLDNIAYSYVTLHGEPQLFFGPTYHMEAKFQVFSKPFEARYIRVNPVAWSGAPSVKLELLGCELATSTPALRLTTTSLTTTTTTTTTPLPITTRRTTTPSITTSAPVCMDKMSNHMNDEQIKASSSTNAPLRASTISVYKDEGWVPLSTDQNHWLQFDFLGERTLTGLMMAGSGFKLSELERIPSWVTSFYIMYGPDEDDWSPLTNVDGTRQIFTGNEDNTNIKTIMFRIPIRGRFVRIIPLEWNNKIALRAQLLGCYEPYPILTTTPSPPPTTTTRGPCQVCPGVTLSSVSECPCSSPQLYWDGELCTVRSQCPCYIGFIPYAVGTTFDNEKCEQCVCGLNGIPQCRKKDCPPCGEDLRSELTASCLCLCKPCDPGSRLCPSSGICVNATLWCDGVADCPDDELNCPTTTLPPTSTTTPQPTTTESAKEEECPPLPICPPGTKLEKVVEPEKKAPLWSPFGSKSKWGSYYLGAPRERQGFGKKGWHKGGGGHGGWHKGGGGHAGWHKGGGGHGGWHKTGHKTSYKPLNDEPLCPKHICSCEDKPDCPPGSKLVIIKAAEEGGCDQFSCPVPPDKYCFVNGRTFTTFDGVEYKYDICDHILARDRIYKEWEIREVKTCEFIGPCEKHLIIKFDNHTVRLNTDQSIVYDGYGYTVPQMQKIGSQNQEFAMKQVNDKFIIFSSRLGFSIIWDSQANIKLVVPGTSTGEVDGLCGFMDDEPGNDKQKPSGELAKTSVEFGDSWGLSLDCETKACPAHVQKEAFEMCQAVRDAPLSECGSALNLDKVHSACVESICLCWEQSNGTKLSVDSGCRCEALSKAVAACQLAQPSADFSSWRVQNDCPVACPPGLVFKECFRRTCEPCCAELLTPDACPETSECFPGCYCPEGYVRSYEQCIKPAECRDCMCEGYGSARFVTFDKLDFMFRGNCTHVLAQTLKTSAGPQFKVFITNGLCENDPSSTCLSKITILYKEHTVQAIKKSKSVVINVDGTQREAPWKDKWISLTEIFGKGLNINLPKIQLDLEISFDLKNYKLKLPSHLYADRTEGLCGSCNVNITDDLKMSNGSITESIDDFGQSWLVKDLPNVFEKEDSCISENIVEECLPPPPEEDKCLILTDKELFGKCHAVIDPSIFVSNCHDAYCTGMRNFCRELEEYARQCQSEGICLKWRSEHLCPYSCPPGLEYEPCGLGCTETCDNFELYRTSPEKCLTPRGDTCVCPHGSVLKNGSCVEESRCSPCDSEGHYPGDSWSPDSCTRCQCSAKSVQCERVQCPPVPLCQLGYRLLVVPGTQDDCCPQQICSLQTKEETCPPPQKMKCGMDQILKLEVNENGCEDFICCCKPKEECTDVSGVIKSLDLEPGFVATIDNSGCCPFVNKSCQPATCPPHHCPEFQEPVIKGQGVCCPIYDCEIPKDQCLYEYTQGELKGTKTLKSSGEVWKDGPCKTCECPPGAGSVASCTEQYCQPPPESDNYQYEATNVNNKCCPIYKRIACKVNGKIYQVGETWPVGDDHCKNTTCTVGASGEVTKEDTVQNCNKDCKKGYEYVEPTAASDRCCGECQPVGCLQNGNIHLSGSVWYSGNNCTSYTCLINDGQVHIVTSETSCPDISDCPQENIYVDQCCKKCNVTQVVDHSACSAELVPLNATLRLVQVFEEEHGPCANTLPIPGFTECKGLCDSSTEFDWRTGQHESSCLCCQGEEYGSLKVNLSCADGFQLERQIPVPTKCRCLVCAASQSSQTPLKLISTKSATKTSGKGRPSVKT